MVIIKNFIQDKVSKYVTPTVFLLIYLYSNSLIYIKTFGGLLS